MLRMDNLAEEEKSIACLLFIEAQSESGEFGDYDYAKTNCDGTIPPKGTFKCKLSLIFPSCAETGDAEGRRRHGGEGRHLQLAGGNSLGKTRRERTPALSRRPLVG